MHVDRSKVGQDIRLAHVLTDEVGTFLSMDDAYCAILGRERSELIGKGAVSFTSPMEQAKHLRAIEQLQRTASPLIIRKSYVRPDGTLVRVENRASAISDGIGPKRLIASIRVLPDEEPSSTVEHYVATARQMLKHRRARHAQFGDAELEWPKWDIALSCYAIEATGRPTTIAAVCRDVGIDVPFGSLRILEMLARSDLEMDYSGTGLADSSIRLSCAFQRTLEQYLLHQSDIAQLMR